MNKIDQQILDGLQQVIIATFKPNLDPELVIEAVQTYSTYIQSIAMRLNLEKLPPANVIPFTQQA